MHPQANYLSQWLSKYAVMLYNAHNKSLRTRTIINHHLFSDKEREVQRGYVTYLMVMQLGSDR